MLDSDLVLDGNHLLKQEYLDLFEVDDSYKTFSLAYYETQERDFFQEGWINRLRLKYEEDAEKDFKLTYKKRYSVPENDLTAAVHLAETEGFDLLSGLWEPQIDWGYTGMTLSLSAEAAVPTGGKKTIADLNPEDGFAMMLENMPEQEQDWKGEHRGSDLFESAVMVGPIFFNRYTNISYFAYALNAVKSTIASSLDDVLSVGMDFTVFITLSILFIRYAVGIMFFNSPDFIENFFIPFLVFSHLLFHHPEEAKDLFINR